MTLIRISMLIIAVLTATSLSTMAADGPDRTAKKYLKKGQAAYEKADLKTAREHLEKAIARYPDYAQAYYTLGQVDLSQEKIQQALGHFAKATDIDPGHVQAQLASGRIFLAAGRPEAAMDRAAAVLKQEPGNQEAILINGSALLAQKRETEAIDLLEPLFNQGQRDRNLVLLLSTAHIRRGDNEQGQAVLQAGIDTHRKDIALYIQLANAHLRSGNLKTAQTVMETVVKIDPQKPAHAVALARLYWEMKAIAKANQLLAQTLEDDPADPARRIVVANFYLDKHEIDRAQDLLRQGIEAGDRGAHLRLALGELYLKTGKAQEAVDLLKLGLETTPAPTDDERVNIQNALARIYLAAKDLASAQSYAHAVLDTDPQNIQALVTRGMAVKAAGKPGDAIPDFKRVLGQKPNFVDGYLQLAEAYVMNRQIQKARGTLNKGLVLAPANRAMRMAMYRACLMDKDYKQAERHLRTLVEKYPAIIAAQAELGDFYLLLNDEDAARREYSEILLKSPRSAIGYIKLARLYNRQKKIDSALDQLRQGYTKVKQNQVLAAELVSILLTTQRYKEALTLCDDRLVKNPEEAFAHNLKGKTFAKMDKLKAARKAFEKAAQIDPMWPEASNNLAAVFLLQDKEDQAIKHFQAALNRNPKNAAAYLSLGRLHENRSESTKAIDVYEKAVDHIPDFWSAANRLAFLIADQATTLETLDRALELAMATYRMKPDQASIIDTLGWIYYKKGETKRSLHLYEQLTAAVPDVPVINYHMGIVLQKSGDIESAKKKLKTATRSKIQYLGREHAEAVLKELESKS